MVSIDIYFNLKQLLICKLNQTLFHCYVVVLPMAKALKFNDYLENDLDQKNMKT